MNFQHHKGVKIICTVVAVYDLLISKLVRVLISLSEAPHSDHLSQVSTLHLTLS